MIFGTPLGVRKGSNARLAGDLKLHAKRAASGWRAPPPSRRRQDKPKRRALVEPALDLQRPADPFHEFPAKQQAEAGAALAGGAGGGGTAFEPEQARDLRLGHADAGVGDGDGDVVAPALGR